MAQDDTSNRDTDGEGFRVLLATSRPALEPFFAGLRLPQTVRVTRVEVDPAAVAARLARDPLPSVALVDIALDPAFAINVCERLQRLAPHLPIAALVCCPRSVTPWSLRTLVAQGVTSVLDLQADAAETARALLSVAQGGSVLNLHLRRAQRDLLREALVGLESRGVTSIQLLELVALGLPDHEIGRRLNFSPHTVKHQLEHLRNALGVRNRIELAAWAGRNGFYRPEGGGPGESVAVRRAR